MYAADGKHDRFALELIVRGRLCNADCIRSYDVHLESDNWSQHCFRLGNRGNPECDDDLCRAGNVEWMFGTIFNHGKRYANTYCYSEYRNALRGNQRHTDRIRRNIL